MTTDTVVTILGGADTVISNPGGTQNNTNTELQLASAVSGFAGTASPSAAIGAIGAGTGAAISELGVLFADINSGASRNVLIADGLTLLGDTGTALGGAVSFLPNPVAQFAGRGLEAAGSATTLASIGYGHYDQVAPALAEFQAVNTALANGSAALQNLVGTTALNAWNAAAADYSAASTALSKALNDIGTANFSADVTNAGNLFNTTLTGISNFYGSVGGTAPNVTIDGTTGVVTVTPSGNASPIAGAGLTFDPSGNFGTFSFYGAGNMSAPVGQETLNADTSGTVTANGQTLNYAAGVTPTVSIGSNGDVQIGVTPTTPGPIETVDLATNSSQATVNGQTFSEAFANTKVTIDVIGDVNFANSAAQPLQTLALESNGGVTQSLYSASVVDQLTQKNFFGSNGTLNGSANMTYSTNSGDTWASQTTITNATGQTVGIAITNKDGTYTLENIDPSTGNVIVSTAVDAQGHTTQQTVNPSANYPAFVQAIADTLATQLISSVLIKNNLPGTIAAQAFADAVVHSALPTSGHNLTFAQDFAQSAFDIAGGIGGSQAGAQIASALGLPSQLGTLTGGVTGNLVTQALVNDAYHALGLTNSTGSVLTAANFASGIGGAGGAVVGSELAGLLLTPTLAGEVTGAVATAAVLASEAELLSILAVSNPITAVLTAFSLALGSNFIGNIVGDIFGGLFGGQPSVGPNANSRIAFNTSTDQFYLLSTNEDNGGDISIPQSMANAAIATLVSVVSTIGGTVTGQPVFQLGYFEGRFFSVDFNDGNPNEYQQNMFNNSSDAVSDTLFRALHQLQFKGGNPYMEYALQHSAATNYAALVSDLNAAHDYSLYVANPLAFDLALAMSGNPSQLTTWQTELAQAHTLGLDQLTTGQLQSLTTFGTIVNSASLSNVGALQGSGWNFSGSGETSFFISNPATLGLSVAEFDASGHVTYVKTLTNSAGQPFTMGENSHVIGTGFNFGGTGGHDFFTRDIVTQQVIAWEFNAAGQWTYGATLTTQQGQPFLLGPTSIVIGTGNNFVGSAGHDFFTRDSVSGQIMAWEFNSSGQWTQYQALTLADGTPFILQPSVMIIGSGTNGAHDLFTYNTATGQAGVIDFDSNAAIVIGAGTPGVTIVGSNDTVTDTNHSDTIQLNAGSIVNASGDTINAVANIGFTVNGGSNTIAGTTGDTITVSGGTSNIVNLNGSAVITDTNSGDTIWVASSGDTVTAANATVHLNSGSSNDVIAGNNDTLDLGSNVGFFDSGANVSINAAGSSGDLIQILNNSSVTVIGGSSNTVAMDGTGSVVTDTESGDSVWLNNPGNTAHTSNNNVFLNGGATTGAVSGSGDTITVLNSGSLTVSGGTSNTVNINGLNATLTDTNSGDTIHLNAGSIVNASGETVTAVANIGFHVNGGGNAVTGTIGDTIFIGGNGQAGPTDTVAASNVTINLADNARADIAGSNNAITAGQNDLVTILSGTDNTVNMNGINSVVTDTASGDTIYANANNDTVNASHDTISIKANTSGVTINGSGDTITPADNASFTVNGTAETLALGTAATVIATKVAYNSTTDQDQFIRDTATGQIAVDKFNSSGALTGGNALTNSNGSAFTLPTGSIIVAGAQNFLGHSGRDIIVESSTGALSVDEFNAAGALLTSTPIIHSSGAGGGAVTFTPGTQVLGTLSNYMGDGGTDLIYQTPDHGITLYEIGTNGQVIDGFYVNNNDASNTPYIAPTTLQFIGKGSNILQAGGSDLIFQEPNGTILPLEMAYYGTIEAGGPATVVGTAQNFLGTGGADKIIALNSNQDLVVLEYNAAGNVVAGQSLYHSPGHGGALSMGSGALVVGLAQNDFNLGGKDLIIWTTDGHLNNYEFNTSTGQIIDGFYLNNTSYQPLTFAAGTTVLGVAQNYLGHGGSDFFIKSPTGVVTTYEYTGYGTVGWTEAETVINGSLAGGQTFSGVATGLNHNVILNFNGLNDKIDITGHAFSGSTAVTYTPAAGTNNQTGTLTISDSAGTIDTVELIGGNNIASFHVASDGNGGILVTDPPAGSTDGETSTLANLMKSGEDRFVFADAHVALQSVAHELFGQSPGAQAPAHESFAAISTNGDQFIFHASMMTMPQPSSSDLFDLPGVGQNPQQAELSHHLAQFGADHMQPFAHTLPDGVGAGTDPAHPDNHLLALHAHDGFHLS